MSNDRKLVLKVVLVIMGFGLALGGCVNAFRECAQVFSAWACIWIVGS